MFRVLWFLFCVLGNWCLFVIKDDYKIAAADDNNNNNIRLLKIDKPQLNREMLKVKVIHTQ